MDSATKFAPPLSYTSINLDEINDHLLANKTEDVPLFLEEFSVEYLPTEKQFLAVVGGDKKQFTHNSFFEFCGLLAIPSAFVNRVPNALLNENIQKLLDDNNMKCRFGVRDDVVSFARKDAYVATDPIEFLEASKSLLSTHLFREGSIGDAGSVFHLEPLKDSLAAPSIENPNDVYNIGVAFSVGFGSGKVRGTPYSLRQICTNVAITPSAQSRYKLIETIKRDTDSSDYYSRLLENYGGEYYQSWFQEINMRITKALEARMTDFRYYNTYRTLNSAVGKESALALMHIEEPRHKEIMDDVQYRKRKNSFDIEHQIELEEGVYEIFNSITAAAKGYDGPERIALQTIGGDLL